MKKIVFSRCESYFRTLKKGIKIITKQSVLFGGYGRL